jgi:hypothetical protein
MKHFGTFRQLQDQVLLTGIYGEWRDLGTHRQFWSDDGGVLNWWPSTGTLWFQGRPRPANELKQALLRVRRKRPTSRREERIVFQL